MKPLTHLQAQHLIQSGQAQTPQENAALAAHMADCSECRTYAEFHTQLTTQLPLAYPLQRHPDREIRQKARQVQERMEKRAFNGWLLRGAQSLGVLAAALVLLLGLGYLVSNLLPGMGGRQTAAPDATAPASQPSPEMQPATTTPAPTNTPPIPFPAQVGFTWVYTKTGYAPAADDPQKQIQGVSQIEERIASIQTQPPYTLIQIQGKKTMVSADEGWEENDSFGLGDYAYWIIIQDNRFYVSYTAPDPAAIQTSDLLLEYEFPLVEGAGWCRSAQQRETAKDATPPADAPCESRREVRAVGPYESAAGKFAVCYEIHDVANSGNVITRFCEGIGVVEVRYDHAGTRFGFLQELTSFANQKPISPNDGTGNTLPSGSNLIQKTPTQELDPARIVEDIVPAGGMPAVTVDGNMAYTGIGSRLVAIDVSNPAAPLLTAQSEELPGTVLKVLTIPSEDHPRVLASAGRYLAVLSTDTPGDLGLLAQSKLPGQITSLLLDIPMNRVYAGGIAHGDAGKGFITILDCSQPDDLKLLYTLQLEAPVRNLAMIPNMLYAALNSTPPKVLSMQVVNDQLGEPAEAILSIPVSSMTAVREGLFIGSVGQMLVYDLTDPARPQYAWQTSTAGDTPLPGTILGFEVRAQTIYTTGRASSGEPFRLAIRLEEPINAGSTIDTSSPVIVAYGMMFVAGDRLEIYDILDAPQLKLLGTYP